MLENADMSIVGPFQMSLLFSRISELQEVGSAVFRNCCKKGISDSGRVEASISYLPSLKGELKKW